MFTVFGHIPVLCFIIFYYFFCIFAPLPCIDTQNNSLKNPKKLVTLKETFFFLAQKNRQKLIQINKGKARNALFLHYYTLINKSIPHTLALALNAAPMQ